ncbi:cation:proton antiporter [Sphingomonas sp. RB3P16]|uniref:cation:proton antiporter n=1 Tax=Parasphingomonas frigoris TaxID=3096163 RepID=UPI002FCB9CBD
MTFLESLLALLFAAIASLQVSRRLRLPYPAMLALGGVVVAFIPGAPTIAIDPGTALALFIAPVLLDAAFDFPLGAAQKLWRPLAILAVGAILVTTAAVTWIGVAFVGLPLAAAVALGAIVAPPDAAAATAVLGTVSLPKRTIAVLKGESLFNDATALLLFGAALAVQASGGFGTGVALQLALAAPGGLVFGIAAALVTRWLGRFVAETLGGNILQFVNAFAVWIIAERLHLSPVLAVVGCAMTLARSGDGGSPRMRVHSFAAWATVVFLLNVLAFLLMGMQARLIVGRMTTVHLWDSLAVAGWVIVAVIVSRIALVMTWNLLAARFAPVRGDLAPPSVGQGVFVAWCGMRGLLTLATAFALPATFPQRDTVVLTAFAVVLATLILQGMTLRPLIHWLGLDRIDDPEQEVAEARDELAQAATAALAQIDGEEAAHIRYAYALQDSPAGARYRDAGLAAVAAERAELEALRDAHRLSDESYYRLQEEIDWRELALLPEGERRIEES